MFPCFLRLGDLLARQADGMDLIREGDRPAEVKQSDVSVQIHPPVVLRVNDDLIDGHDLLNAALKPGEIIKKVML